VAAARHEIQQIDPDQPIAASAALSTLLADSLALPRVQTMLLGAFAGLALLLAAVGLYGVMSYAVSQRTQEIGVRMALGARRGSVLLMVLRQASLLTAIGLAIGLGGAIAVGRALTSFLEPLLFHVKPYDVLTLVVVSGVLAFAALVAALIPARRATQVDPMQALRTM
jgi:ABC-type antimicrobial peptide transport system permease subunit